MTDSTSFASVVPTAIPLASRETRLESFESGWLSNAILRFGETDIPVHKELLSEKSPYFNAAFKQLEENSGVPILTIRTQPNTYNIIMKSMIRFCYTGDYEEPEVGHSNRHIQIHFVAHTFQIHGLAGYSAQKYRNGMRIFCEHEDINKVADYLKAITATLWPRPETADLVRTVCSKHFRDLIAKLHSQGDYEKAFQFMKENPAAAAEFFHHEEEIQRDPAKPSKDWKCSNCGTLCRCATQPKRDDMRLPVCPCCMVADQVDLGCVKRAVKKRKLETIDLE